MSLGLTVIVNPFACINSQKKMRRIKLATNFRCCFILLAMIACLIHTGCGGLAPGKKGEGIQVSGKVLLPNGNPLAGGTLILRPENGLFGATSHIQPDGSFALKDGKDDRVEPGKYQVFIRFSDPSLLSLQKQVNERYQQSSEDGESDIVIDISTDTDDLIIRLNR